MKKLYVSDLDGTLLNQRGDISATTAEIEYLHRTGNSIYY